MVVNRVVSFLTSIDELLRRLQRLEARCGNEELVAKLARAFDAGPSATQLRPLFIDEARFEIDDYGIVEGADVIAQQVAANSDAGFGWTLHYLVSPIIKTAPDYLSATVEFMLWEVATAASGKAYWIGGKYYGTTVASGEAWQFVNLRLEADLISHYKQGWSPKPKTLDGA